MFRIVISAIAIGLLSLPVWGAVPTGFDVLGTTVPPGAENIPITPGYTELPPTTNTTPPTFSAGDISRGYATFVTNVLTPIYPVTLPLQAELTDQLMLSEVAGEYEPVVFSIHAISAQTDVSIAAGNLVFNANTIDAENIDVRSVRAMPRKAGVGQNYIVSPTLFEKRAMLDIPLDRTQQYWVTVFVPPGTPAGTYTGQLTISSQGNPDSTMDLTVEVLDLQLLGPGSLHGMYYDPLDRTAGGATFSAQRLSDDMINMGERGMTTIFISEPPSSSAQLVGQDVVFDVSAQNDVRDAALAAAFSAVIFNTTIDDLIDAVIEEPFHAMLRGYVAALQAAGWPTIIASYGDENIANGGYNGTYNRLGQIKNALPNIQTYTTMVFPNVSEAYEPHLDCRAFSSYIDETAKTNTTAAGKQLWEYSGNVGYGLNPLGERFYRGLWSVLFDFGGVMQWRYYGQRYDVSQPFNDLIAGQTGNNMTCYAFPGVGGPLNSPGFEAKREGIQDQRYAVTLESMIAQAQNYPSNGALQTLAQNAQTFLDGVYAGVDLSPTQTAEFTIRREVNKLAIDDLDNFRNGCIQHIQLLAAVLNSIQPANCTEVTNLQALWVTDLNGDCVIDFLDYALFAASWMDCNIPGDPSCI